METRVRKWGNSLGLRIPKSIAEQTGVKEGSSVKISIEDERLVITPVQVEAYRLSDLLEQVTEENTHTEVDTGDSVGREGW